MDVRRRILSFGCQSESADSGRWAARDAGAWTSAAPSAIPLTIAGQLRKRSTRPVWRVFATLTQTTRGAPTGSALILSNTVRCPWLSAAQLSVADRQPAHRFLRRQPRQPHALPARGGGRDPRGLVAPEAARHAHPRLRLGRRRDHDGRGQRGTRVRKKRQPFAEIPAPRQVDRWFSRRSSAVPIARR
jgi:hypothetical protein